MSDGSPHWTVLKFGGTSVASRANWENIADVAARRLEEGVRPLVVCSAVSGISRMLDRYLNAAVKDEHEPVLEDIKRAHRDLGEGLGVDADELLTAYYDEIERLGLGASLTEEVSPRLRARVLSTGELMSTTLGAAFLNEQGLTTRWRDARGMLRAVDVPRKFEYRRYLTATCEARPDAALRNDLMQEEADVILTQGFIASDDAGDTVLLGWGGSDTSAAYFAARLMADRLEIWTDVPGMFTSNPRKIPSARHVRRLDYEEAQELATTGAEVLHPRSIDPVRRQQIPLHIRCTQAPELEGTIITDETTGEAQVKAVSPKLGITLIAIDTTDMWQEVGFLAGVFETLKDYNLSVDLIATSETNVTFSLDRTADALDPATVQALLRDLEEYGSTRAIGPCAAVSLVGHNIRSILHEMGPALRLANEQHVYLMAQAASDINLTFVVDEEEADTLTEKLHDRLFEDHEENDLFGNSWEEMFGQPMAEADGRERAG